MALPTNRPNSQAQPPVRPKPVEEVVLPSFGDDFELPLPEMPAKPARWTPEPVQTLPESDFDDDIFTSLPPTDASIYEDDEDWDAFDEPEIAPQPERRFNTRSQPAPQVVEDFDPEPVKPSRKGKEKKFKPGHTEDTFIDEEKAKLKPFGSGRSKRKAKVNEFDNRKNLRQRSKIIQYIVLAGLVILIGLGVKNALIPPKTLTQEDINNSIVSELGDKGFPMDTANGFVTSFMDAYMNYDPTDPMSIQMLNYFYTGELASGTSVNEASRLTSSDIIQRVIIGPNIYTNEALTEYSARFTVGALVELSSKKDGEDSSVTRWQFFNVNVYYDKETQGMVIAPGSPTIVAAPEFGTSTKVPNEAPLGTGQADQELTKEVSSVVTGFVKGYAISSANDHSAIDQYVIPDAPVDLQRGLDSRYVLSEDNSAISYTAFPTDQEGLVKVDVQVKWRDSLSSDLNTTYSSQYIMTLQKQTNGKWLVAKFAPRFFFKK